VSRLCIQGDIFHLSREFPRPEYELSVVSSCDLCPTYQPATGEIDREELKRVVREVLRELFT
jgi:hypothetical protein